MDPLCDSEAVLLLAFGGPERMEDVRPFLDNVLKDRPVPAARYEEVVGHYERLGGRSPLLELTQNQADALGNALRARGTAMPVHVGMRHWHPYIGDALDGLVDAGIRRIVAPIMSAFDSPASRQAYEELIERELKRFGSRRPEVLCIGGLGTQAGFVDANAAHLREALAASAASAASATSAGAADRPLVVFTAHSIPESAARRSPYVEQYRGCADAVCRALDLDLAGGAAVLAYQSRSGNPRMPWLGPDVLDVIREHARNASEVGTPAAPVVLSPIGFACDHVEVLYDLDVEAAELAHGLGISLVRAQAANAHPAFVAGIADAASAALRGCR